MPAGPQIPASQGKASPPAKLSKGQAAATVKLFAAFTGKPPVVSTSHPALEPQPSLPKIPTPAYGGASSRAPKVTKGLEPHAKLPPVVTPATSPKSITGPKGLTGLKPAIQPGPPVSKPTAAQLTKNWGSGPVAAAAVSLYKPVESVLVKGGHLLASGEQAVSNEVTSIRNKIANVGGLSTSRNLPGATISAAAAAQSVFLHGVQDAVNLPAEVIPSTIMTAKAAISAVQGHPAQLEQMGGQIVNQLTSVKGWEQHPLNNFLMASGALHGAARSLYAVKDAAGLADHSALFRPDEHLYGNVITHRMPYSKDPITRLQQKIADQKNPAVESAFPGPRPRWLQTFATKVGRKIDEVYGTHATMWRSRRTAIEHQRQDAITDTKTPSSRLRQLGANARNPQRPLLKPEILGREAVNLIAQGVLRRPDTIKSDATKAIQMIESTAVKRKGGAAERMRAETLGRLHAIRNDSQFHAHPEAAFEAARKYAEDHAPLQQKLVDRGYVSQEAVDHAKLVPYAVTHMGATHEAGVGLVDQFGRPLTDDRIIRHMQGAGVNPDHVAFISHRQGSDARARWGSLTGHGLAETKERTGEAFRAGMTDISHGAVVRQHLMSALQVFRHDAANRINNTFVLRNPGGKDFITRDEASLAADDPAFRAGHNVPEGVQLIPYRLTPQFARRSQMTAIKAGLNEPEDFFDENKASSASAGYQPTLKATTDTSPGPYGLIAKDAADRLMAHEQPASIAGRLGRGSAGLFRMSTLPFSPKRVVGLPQETAIRLVVGRAGVTSRLFEAKLEKAVNDKGFQARNPQAKEAMEYLVARSLGGQSSGQALRLRIHNAPDWYRGTPFEGGARKLAALRETPGPGHVLAAFQTTARGILHWQKAAVEQQASRAALGKAALIQLEQQTGMHWSRALSLHQKAVEDFLVHHMLNSENQDMFGRYNDEMLGKWSNHSPLMTKALMASPFLSWYTNSLRFLYATLPADHPVITGLMAASNTATAGPRAQYGLSGPLSNNPLEVPGYLEGGYPTGGKMIDFAHYSPFGAVSDLAGAAKSELPPLVTGLSNALQGLDFTGKYPKNASGQRVEPSEFEKVKMGLGSIFDTILPGYSVAERGASKPSSFLQPLRIYKSYPRVSSGPGGLGTSLGSSLGGSLGARLP